MDNVIDLSGLLPSFSSIGNVPLTAEQLSALFLTLLLMMFFGFLLLSIYSLVISLRQTSWVSDLLKNETLTTIISNREELVEKARQTDHQGGHLWREFDETLIEVEHNGSVQLRNILDSHHFFNSATLARGITESRMLAAVPGFLTAAGVIGTFVGLQLGLSELNIGNDVEVKKSFFVMKDSMTDPPCNGVNRAGDKNGFF